LTGSKFRTVCVEIVADIYVFIRRQFDDDYQLRQNPNNVRSSSNFGLEMRNGLLYDRRTKRVSTSAQQTYTYALSNSSKRASNDTVVSSQVNSRRQSRCVFNVQEI
jgi:hypothetical protein